MASDQGRILKDALASVYTLYETTIRKKVNNKEKKKNDNLPLKIAVFLAQKEGFEPSRRFPDLLP